MSPDIVQVMSSDLQKEDIDIRECQMLMLRKRTYILAGIHVLRKATEAGILEIRTFIQEHEKENVQHLIKRWKHKEITFFDLKTEIEEMMVLA